MKKPSVFSFVKKNPFLLEYDIKNGKAILEFVSAEIGKNKFHPFKKAIDNRKKYWHLMSFPMAKSKKQMQNTS